MSPDYQKDKRAIGKSATHIFTRMIEGFSSLLYTERLMRLGIWTLEEIRNRCDLIEVYKMFNGYRDRYKGFIHACW